MAEATYTGRRIGTRGLVATESRHTLYFTEITRNAA